MTRHLVIIICCFILQTKAQTIYELKEKYIIRLTKTINPQRDSIQRNKIKDIRNILYSNGSSDTTIISSYDKTGNVLTSGNYIFRYDSLNRLSFFRYYFYTRDQGQGFDSIDLTQKLDTNKVHKALQGYNEIFYENSIYKIQRARHNDSLKFKNARIELYCPYARDTTCSISDILFQNYGYSSAGKNILEIIKYDYGHHPPAMEIIQYDTVNKITKTFSYGYPSNRERQLSYTYRLLNVYRVTNKNDHREFVYESYVGKNDKVFDFPQSIDIEKYYKDRTEYYIYKKTFFKKQKLIKHNKIVTITTYFK